HVHPREPPLAHPEERQCRGRPCCSRQGPCHRG
ncbi:hypothetical protein BN1708_017547, partial [Verticillium longisporum]